jgi:hypothetical protein
MLPESLKPWENGDNVITITFFESVSTFSTISKIEIEKEEGGNLLKDCKEVEF